MDKHRILVLASILVPMILVTVATIILVQGTYEYRLPLAKTGRYTEDKSLIHVRGLIDLTIYVPGYKNPVYNIRGRVNTSNTSSTVAGELVNPRSGAIVASFRGSYVYVSATTYSSISIASLLYIIGVFAGIAGTAILVYKGRGLEVYLALIPLMTAIISFALALLLAKITGSIIVSPTGGGGVV